jgi:hypothetical protein
MVLASGRAQAESCLLAFDDLACDTVLDWAQTFSASRDPQARRPDIYVDIQPSLTVPGTFQIELSEHIANAERPLTVRVDGVSPKRVVASPFAGDVWGEALSDLDDDLADPGEPQLAAAPEGVVVFELPGGIQLGLYQLVSAGEPIDLALRYLRARTHADVTASDVALRAQPTATLLFAMDSSSCSAAMRAD